MEGQDKKLVVKATAWFQSAVIMSAVLVTASVEHGGWVATLFACFPKKIICKFTFTYLCMHHISLFNIV